MTTAIRRWVQAYRYRVIVRELRSLSLTELRALEIEPSEINYLAFEASRGEQPKTTLRLPPKKASYAEKPLMFIMPLAALGDHVVGSLNSSLGASVLFQVDCVEATLGDSPRGR